MKHRIRLFGSLTTITLLLFAACGGGGGGGTPPPPALAAPVATAVGTPLGSAATSTLGAAGGTLSSPDGRVTLDVPAGALAADTVISIQPITNHAHGGRGNAYRFTPDGQTFQMPVTLTFTYIDADLEGTVAEALGAAYQSADGYWHWVKYPVLDIAAKTVTVSIVHFTDYADAAGFNLRPGAATVKVGGTVGLHVKFCYPASVDDGSQLGSLVVGLECYDPGAPDALGAPGVSQWTVSGAGGVSGGSFSATYTAPAAKPTPNTAVVNARIDNTKFGTLYLLSHITIIDAVTTYTGDLAFNEHDVYSDGSKMDYYGTARLSFALSSVTQVGTPADPGYFLPDGATASFTVDSYSSSDSIENCTLIGTAVGPAATAPGVPPVIGQLVVRKDPMPGYPFPFAAPAYAFQIQALASGMQRCVRNSDGTVTTKSLSVLVNIGTTPGTSSPGNPGFQPLTDELRLSGSASTTMDFPGSYTDTWDSTWSLAGQ
jgi:hypothetical protein